MGGAEGVDLAPGKASPSESPPETYWAWLRKEEPPNRVDELRRQFDKRMTRIDPGMFGPPASAAIKFLERVSNDGWLEKTSRPICSSCRKALSEEEAKLPACVHCAKSFGDGAEIVSETVYLRHSKPGRVVDWVIAIHGMNTRGAWQEAFSWHLATTWGKSVPVAVYKYGWVITGVIMWWRRWTLRDQLRTKLKTLRDQALAHGYNGKPDVIAHSFGTWLFGHLLQKELARKPADRLEFGRLILTGSVLRPDFDWAKIKQAGLVSEVMNHYGTKDPVVVFAEATIWDSGPSGRRGFDGNDVINVRAEGFGHSDLFSVTKFVGNAGLFATSLPAAVGRTYLVHAYSQYWKPFFTLPNVELNQLPDRVDPSTRWRPLPWLFRGTLFPPLVMFLLVSLLMLALDGVGLEVRKIGELFRVIAFVSGAALLSILSCIVLVKGVRRFSS